MPTRLLALVHVPRVDVADVAHGGGVRARGRAGQREAGHFLALGQARQVVVLLLVACRTSRSARPGRASSAP